MYTLVNTRCEENMLNIQVLEEYINGSHSSNHVLNLVVPMMNLWYIFYALYRQK